MQTTEHRVTQTAISNDENQTLQFVSLFVHDLEGPLVSVKTILRLLERGRFDTRKELHRELLQSSTIALERAEALIYDLLSAARAGETSLVADIRDCRLNDTIVNSCRMARPAAGENRVVIAADVPPESPVVRADASLLARILDNLIFNAIRHTPPDGRIIVSATCTGDDAEITVTDSGPGFKDVNPEDLFTVYKQAEYRVRGLHRGVGIGLYLCRLAVDLMGGSISAANAAGLGAVFRFTLPLGGNDR